jgi:hypothetical protein
MSKEISIREWVPKFLSGAFIYPDRKIQISAGWFDWFCDDRLLAAKTAKMGKIIAKIKDGGKVNLDTQYTFFKNNCPMIGAFYDQFSICDRETGDVIYCVQNRYRKWQVYDVKNWNADDSPHFEGTASALVKYLNTKE